MHNMKEDPNFILHFLLIFYIDDFFLYIIGNYSISLENLSYLILKNSIFYLQFSLKGIMFYLVEIMRYNI